MPSIGIQPNPELERAIILDGSIDLRLLQHLLPIKPQLVIPGLIRLPLRLDLDPMPLARSHVGKVAEEDRRLLADCPLLDPRGELVPLEKDHIGRHEAVAVAVREIGDELGDVVGLCGELPVLSSEGKLVRALIAPLVHVLTRSDSGPCNRGRRLGSFSERSSLGRPRWSPLALDHCAPRWWRPSPCSCVVE